ncbi:MAG TPA: hypothetical protein VIQ00_00085 [Chitinophagaceae bacterium]
MSTYEFRPRGGMEGIKTNEKEMLKLASAVNSKYLDGVIPLPNVPQSEQIELLATCKHEAADYSYWETETGKHGWCCNSCGTVIQWG